MTKTLTIGLCAAVIATIIGVLFARTYGLGPTPGLVLLFALLGVVVSWIGATVLTAVRSAKGKQTPQ